MRLCAAALIVLLAACKKQEEPPKPAAPSALAEAARSLSAQPEPLPSWTQKDARFEKRGSRRYAVAVGEASAANFALARVAAQERARAKLARLLHRKPPTASLEAVVTGAQLDQTYTAADGRVFVQLSAPESR